jgi:hypothetical protein
MTSAVIADNFWQNPRVFHRRVRITTTGSAGSATGGAYIPVPPSRLTHFAINHHASGAATTNTSFLADGLSDGSTGTQVFLQTDAVTDIPIRGLGSPAAVDEGRNATAATDGVEGGAFIKKGVYVKVIENDALAEAMVVDLWFERLRLETVELIAQSGADGAGAVTRTLDLNGAGTLLGVQFDFQNTPATADVVIKADSSAGETLFTSTSSQTDFGPSALGIIGLDEGNAAVAATDGIGGGQPFRRGLYFDVAESDAFTTGNERILVYAWIRQ